VEAAAVVVEEAKAGLRQWIQLISGQPVTGELKHSNQ
jgi:hypothetical protein